MTAVSAMPVLGPFLYSNKVIGAECLSLSLDLYIFLIARAAKLTPI
jgi:hypothetical protein